MNNVNTIDKAFEIMRTEWTQSVALLDAISAYAVSKADLEGLFYKWCWSAEDEPHPVGEDLAYSIELGRIEESLCIQGLIYQVD